MLRVPTIWGGEGPLADFKNRKELDAWLRKQPREVSVAFAARAALRGLPLLQEARRAGDKGDLFSGIVLGLFRVTAVSWAAARYSAHETELATTTTAIADAADAFGATAFWSAVSIDATRVEQGRTASDIAGLPLWPNDQPDRLRSLWQEMKEGLLAAKQDWQVWTIWYDDRLDGRVREEERELAYVRIDNDLWEQGPAIVNAEIKGLIEAHTAPTPRHVVLAEAPNEAANAASSNRVGAAKSGIAASRRPMF